MARPKKSDDPKGKGPAPIVAPAPPTMTMQMPMQAPLTAAPAPMPLHQPRHIDPEGFIRVRDSVHQRLLTILELIKSFSADYYRQTSLLLGEHSGEIPGIDGPPFAPLEHAMQTMAMPGALMPGAAEYGAPPVEEKKERKKRTHDPNAPKRPLTPYFLYMQTARPIIANDLGTEAPKGAVQEEGQRRWKAMGQGEKNGWNNAYQYNLRLYQARVHSYKHGNPDARVMNDDDALQYAEANGIPLPQLEADATTLDDHEAIAEQLQAAPGAAGDDSATKTPKKGGGRKRKSEVAEVEAPKSAAAAAATPDAKKRRRTSKAADAEAKEESTAKKPRGKKAKN